MFLSAAMIVALAALPERTLAGGVTRIQQPDGTDKSYSDVRIRFVGDNLWITSADRRGTLEVVDAACSLSGALRRCLANSLRLHQAGRVHDIDLDHGMVFANLTNQAQVMHLGQAGHNRQLAANEVDVSVLTIHGTYITVHGTLDEVAK
jgi:hypothetical protein